MKSKFNKRAVEKNSYGDVTYRKVFGPKWPALIAFTLALFADLTALLYVLVKGGGIGIWLFPLILLALTAVMLGISVFTDYRFKYSVFPVVLYIVLSAVVMAMFTYLTVANVDVTVSTFGYLFLGISHVLTYLFSVALVFGGNGYAPKQRRCAFAFTLLLTVLTVASVFTYLTFGFYGQGIGIFDKEMVLVYSYDSETDSYEVKSLLAGRGDTLNIPAEFNGKPINKVSCDVFLHAEVDSVVLAEGLRVELTSTELLLAEGVDATALPSVTTDVDTVNHLRSQLFDLAVANGANVAAMTLCDSFSCTASEGKVELHFEYDLENFPLGAEPGFIPVFLLDEGTVFSYDDYLEYVPYFEYLDPTTPAQLAKAYTEINGYCLFSPTFKGSGETVEQAQLTAGDYRVSLAFDRVYLVDLLDGNDGLYTTPDELGQTVVDGTSYDGKFVRASALADYVTSLPGREGFTVSYSSEGTAITGHESLKTLLESSGGTADILPTWTVIPPVINGFATDKTSFVYGDAAAVFNADVSCALDVKYAFYKGTKIEDSALIVDSAKKSYTLNNPIPRDSDSYTVAVYVSDASTALTCSPVYAKCTLSVSKKAIDVQWSLPTDVTYNTEAHPYSAAIAPADMVGSDQLDLELTLADNEEAGVTVTECINAGRYTLSVAFENSSYNELYTIRTPQKSFSVARYPANVSWGATSFVYNAQGQQPTVSVSGVSGTPLTVSLTSTAGVDAKNYEAVFAFDRLIDARNYSVDYTVGYTITPAPLTAVWGATSFVYNAQARYAEISSLEGLCGSDLIDLTSVTYAGKNANAGTHVVTASLPSSVKNYTLTNKSTEYTVTPLSITLKADDASKTYDGAPYNAFSVNAVTELPAGDSLDKIVTRFGYGEAEGKVNVVNGGLGGYEIALSVVEQGTKYANYSITFVSGRLTIEPRDLLISAEDKSHVYDGQSFTDFTVAHQGLASTDKLGEVVAAFGYGEAASGVNVNSYTIGLSVATEGTKYGNYNVALKNGTLNITKRSVTVKADDKVKTYDAMPYTAFTSTVTGLAVGDSVEELASFSYGGSDAINAGSYTITPSVNVSGAKYGNYEITFLPGTLTVQKYAITITADSGTKEYDGFVFSDFTVTGPATLPGEDTMSEIISSYSYGTAEAAVNVNTYVITLAVKQAGPKYNNYQVNFRSGSLVITKKSATVFVDSFNKTYDGKTASFTAKSNDLASTDSLSEIAAFSFGAAQSAVKAGSYSITLSVAARGAKYGNYELTLSEGATLTVDKKAITVTAEDLVKTYDGKTAEFTVSAVGLAEGDTLASIGTFGFGDCESTVNVGVYTLTPSVSEQGERYGCYEITFVSGQLIIGARELTVSADSLTKTYDGKTAEFTVSAVGLAEGDELSEVIAAFGFGDADGKINAGTYNITLSISETGEKYGNYTVTTVNGTLTVETRKLTVTASDATKIADGAAYTDFILTAEGLAEGDELSDVIAVFGYGEAQDATEVGEYKIELSVVTEGEDYSNYDVTLVDGTLTVNEAPSNDEGEEETV